MHLGTGYGYGLVIAGGLFDPFVNILFVDVVLRCRFICLFVGLDKILLYAEFMKLCIGDFYNDYLFYIPKVGYFTSLRGAGGKSPVAI